MTSGDHDATTAEGAGAPAATVAIAADERPPPGSLARGVWEAPAGAFYASAAVVLLAALLYGAGRAGLLRRRGPHA